MIELREKYSPSTGSAQSRKVSDETTESGALTRLLREAARRHRILASEEDVPFAQRAERHSASRQQHARNAASAGRSNVRATSATAHWSRQWCRSRAAWSCFLPRERSALQLCVHTSSCFYCLLYSAADAWRQAAASESTSSLRTLRAVV